MFCTKCGYKNEDDAIFCANCGSIIVKKNNADDNSSVNKDEMSEQNISEKNEDNQFASQFFENVTQTQNKIQNEIPTPNEIPTQNEIPIQNEIPTPNEIPTQNEIPTPNEISTQDNVQNHSFDGGETTILDQSLNHFDHPVEEGFNQSNNVQAPQQMQQTPQQMQQTPQQMQQAPQQMQQAPQEMQQQALQQNGFNSSNNNYQVKKFSITRFICSILIVIATIGSVSSIAFDYVSMKVNISYDSKSDSEKYSVKGSDIIKETPISSDSDEKIGQGLITSLNIFRYMIIALEISTIVFGLIDIVLLSAMRRRSGYFLTFIFGLIKGALAGGAVYLWSIVILDKFKSFYSASTFSILDFDFIKLSFMPEIGLYIAIGCQILTVILSIVLMCTKNRPKRIA